MRSFYLYKEPYPPPSNLLLVSQRLRHCSTELKRFPLPSHPPYTKRSHRPDAALKKYCGINASQGPVSGSSRQMPVGRALHHHYIIHSTYHHINVITPPSNLLPLSQRLRHCSTELKRFPLPSHPPYTKRSQVSVSWLK